MKKVIVLFLLASSFVFCSCKNKDSGQPSEDPDSGEAEKDTSLSEDGLGEDIFSYEE